MNTVVKIAEPSRNALKNRLVQAMAQNTCEDIERQLSALERMLAGQLTDAMHESRDSVVHDAGVRIFLAAEEGGCYRRNTIMALCIIQVMASSTY